MAFAALTAPLTALITRPSVPRVPPPPPDPFDDIDDVNKATTDPKTAAELEVLVDRTRDEILAFHFATRPRNTTKNYVLKQKEWSVRLLAPLSSTLANP
jgi:hypothetical protein